MTPAAPRPPRRTPRRPPPPGRPRPAVAAGGPRRPGRTHALLADLGGRPHPRPRDRRRSPGAARPARRADMLVDGARPGAAHSRRRRVASPVDRPEAWRPRRTGCCGPPAAPVRRRRRTAPVVAAGEPRRTRATSWTTTSATGRPHLVVAQTRGRGAIARAVRGAGRDRLPALRRRPPRRARPAPRRGRRAAGRTRRRPRRPDRSQALAVAWAVRDVLALPRRAPTRRPGRRPSTSGLELDPRRQAWTRHPHCGCAWDAADAGAAG